MAQGDIKKAKAKPETRPAQLARRGSRIIKPKKPFLISQQKVKKAHTSGLTGQTEKLLGERAGHLELLKGGKRDKKNADAAAKIKIDKAKGIHA